MRVLRSNVIRAPELPKPFEIDRALTAGGLPCDEHPQDEQRREDRFERRDEHEKRDQSRPRRRRNGRRQPAHTGDSRTDDANARSSALANCERSALYSS